MGLFFLLAIGLVGCNTTSEIAPAADETLVGGSEQPITAETQAGGSEQTSPTSSTSNQATPTSTSEESEPDPAAIEAEWQSSPHADTFILDASGQNNTCARCHAPINWLPSMDDLPESCFACKFELEEPPATIFENEWVDIPCNICHKVDKKDNVQPEFAWLEIAPLEEYAEVASVNELCLKCHASADIPGHGIIQLGGDHPNYVCTDCHSAHSTTTSCDADGCHPDVVEPVKHIPGHDQDHTVVTCGACHDASGMEVGPDEESGLWTTFLSGIAGVSTDRFPFTSHNIVLEAPCDRCHFVSNPWGLSESVEGP